MTSPLQLHPHRLGRFVDSCGEVSQGAPCPLQGRLVAGCGEMVPICRPRLMPAGPHCVCVGGGTISHPGNGARSAPLPGLPA